MDDDIENELSNTSHVPHARCPSFNKQEVTTLIRLVEEHKNIILNKAINSSMNHAKEIAWHKIAKSFNIEGFENIRSTDHLKTKWENIKREARKISKNLINTERNDYNYLLSQVVHMLNEPIEVPVAIDVDESERKRSNTTYWEEDDKNLNQTIDRNDESENSKTNRSLNFSPQECSLLLRCVKSEQRHIFSKETTGSAVKLKNNAWTRITRAFNKLSTQKRTTRVLRTKFNNMKKLTRSANVRNRFYNRHNKLEEDDHSKDIKTEPFEGSVDKESGTEASHGEHVLGEEFHCAPDIELEHPDPLTTFLNEEFDCINNYDSLNQTQDKEISKLQLELLKYQLETAKMDRQRIQERTESDRSDRESKAIEMALRLRAARLELLAAESKLPAAHPALHYYYTETKARGYMQQFSNT